MLPTAAFYERLGIDLELTAMDGHFGPQWTGSKAIFDLSDSYGDALLWHELAHWWVATREERLLPDFGLGPSANASNGFTYDGIRYDIFTHAGPNDHVFLESKGRWAWELLSWPEPDGKPVSTISPLAGRKRSAYCERFACLAIAAYDVVVRGAAPGTPLDDSSTWSTLSMFSDFSGDQNYVVTWTDARMLSTLAKAVGRPISRVVMRDHLKVICARLARRGES